jgi:membrane protein YqaA with SNARE-associated domain
MGGQAMRMSMARIIGGVVMILVIILIISSTLGREIMAGRQPGLGSFSIIHFAGYLFFLLMPVEALVPYYHAEGHAAMILVGLSVGTAIAAQLIDYGVGRLLSERVVSILGHRKYERFNRAIDRHGSWAILVFNLLPLSSPNVILVAGIMRFSLRRTVLISACGLVGKYLTIVYLFG